MSDRQSFEEVRRVALLLLARHAGRGMKRMEAGPKFKTFARIRNKLDHGTKLTASDHADLCELLDALLHAVDVRPQFFRTPKGRPRGSVAPFVAIDVALRNNARKKTAMSLVADEWKEKASWVKRMCATGAKEATWWLANNDSEANRDSVAAARRMYLRRKNKT
ncbi:MAG: hypothetical protein WD929_09565 [Steroidobacteraceae bacterium]